MSILKELRFFAKELSILVVEDDKELNEELVELIKIFFKSVDFAYNGKEGLEKYQNKKYDVIMSDITMPEMNGVKLSQEIKNINREQSILILSAHSEIEYLIELIDIGIHQFVAKPFEQQELLYRLLKVCENIVYKKEYIKIKDSKNTTPKTNQEKPIKAVKKEQKQESKRVEVSKESTPNKAINHEQVNASEFIKTLQNDNLMWNAMESHIEDLIELNSDFEECIERIYLNDINDDTIYEIAVILRKIYTIFTFVDQLANLGEIVYELAIFLESLEIDTLGGEQKNKLKILEFIYDDISRFIQTVFIYQDTLDVFYLEDSLRSSIQQLKQNVLNEDIEEEELELF